MVRYGRDYDRWGGMPRYDRDYGPNSRGRWGSGYGGMRSDGWGSDWRNFPGDSGWLGGAIEGYPNSGYDVGFRGGGSRYDRLMRGRSSGGYGMAYTGREMGYGGHSTGGYDSGEYGMGIGERGPGRQSAGRSMRITEIMTPSPETVTADASLKDVAARMRDLDVGIIPVVDDKTGCHLQGVITDRDIAIRAVADGKDGNTKVRDCMTTEVGTVNKNDMVESALNLMKRDQVRRVPVTDREGRLVGIVSQADLAVEFAADRPHREQMVESTLERVSEPARPRRPEVRAGGMPGHQNQQDPGMEHDDKRKSRQR